MLDPQCARLEFERMVNMSSSARGGLVGDPSGLDISGVPMSLALLEDLWKRCYVEDLHTDANYILVAGSVFAIGVIILTILWSWKTKSARDVKKPHLKRSVSFTSSMMAARVLPKHVNYPEPIINVYIEFKECPTVEDMMQTVVSKMLQYDRMAKVPVLNKQTEHLSFSSSISYDKTRLVRKITIHNDTQAEVIQTMRDHIHDKLDDPNQRGLLPWWEIVIFENKGMGNSACLWRIHHSLGDGISLAMVAQNTLQFADGTPITSVIPEGMMDKKKKSGGGSSSGGSNKLPLYTLAWKMWVATLQVLWMPNTKPDDPTVFSQGMKYDAVHTHNREIVVFPTLPLDFVKAIKNAAGVSINDVLFTCLSQAIRDYLEEQDCPVVKERGSKLLCRALIAAVLPRSVQNPATETLQNKWFFLSSDLGVGVSPQTNDIMERLQYLHKHLSSLKTSPVPFVGLAIQNYLQPYVPRFINEHTIWNVLCKRSVSISNVPGPSKTCVFANQQGVAVNMFLSCSTPHVAFISYGGQIFGNITLDPDAIPNSSSLARHLNNAVVSLAERLNVPIPDEVSSFKAATSEATTKTDATTRTAAQVPTMAAKAVLAQ